jgi:ankyrin repeat protein
MNFKSPTLQRRLSQQPGYISIPHGLASGPVQADVSQVRADWFEEVRTASIEAIEAMLRVEPDLVNRTDASGASAMMLAIRLGHVDVVDLLREHGANIVECAEHPNDQRASELVRAANGLQASLLAPTEFAERLGRFHAPDSVVGRNALTYAVACGASNAMIELLVGPRHCDGASSPIDRLNVLDGLGQSPLSLAVEKCNDAHADPAAGSKLAGRDTLSRVATLLALGARPDLEDGRKRTALTLAARAGNAVLVDLLLTNGARASGGEMPHTALVVSALRGHAAVTATLWQAVLKESGASDVAVGQQAAAALVLAAETGHAEVVGTLLKLALTHGVGWAPAVLGEALDKAVTRGHAAVADHLLSHNAAAEWDGNKRLRLLVAAIRHEVPIPFAALWWCWSADVLPFKARRGRLLQAAAAAGADDVVAAIIKKPTEPSTIRAALDAAVERGHCSTIRILLKKAPSLVEGASGVHLLETALAAGQAESFHLLRQYGAALDKVAPQNLVPTVSGHWHLLDAVLALYVDPAAVLAQALTEIDSVEGTRKLLELGAGNVEHAQAVVTAIRYAASTGNLPVVELLLTSQAASAMHDSELSALKSAVETDRLLSAAADPAFARVLELFDSALDRRRQANS